MKPDEREKRNLLDNKKFLQLSLNNKLNNSIELKVDIQNEKIDII